MDDAMWPHVDTKSFLTALAVLAVATIALLTNFFTSRMDDPVSLWSLAGKVTLVWGVFVFAFEKWIWRWPLSQHIGLVKSPDLTGTWRGQLHSETFGTTDDVTVSIRHSLSELIFVLATPAAINTSQAAALRFMNRDFVLFVLYDSQPRGKDAAPETRPHTGALRLTFYQGSKRPSRQWTLSGDYWTNKGRGSSPTDRGTTGSLELQWTLPTLSDIRSSTGN
jgi:SMODS-associating 2TM, beta-strand rich effector domain